MEGFRGGGGAGIMSRNVEDGSGLFLFSWSRYAGSIPQVDDKLIGLIGCSGNITPNRPEVHS